MFNFGRRFGLQLALALTVLFALLAWAANSRPRWSTSTPVEPPSFSGYIYGGNVQRTGVYSAGGEPKFGDRLWKYKADNRRDAEVIVSNGLAFLCVFDYQIHAIDVKTGELKYTLDAAGTTPTVADGVLYYAARDGLHAMDLVTRKDNWVFKAGDLAKWPLVYNGVVYFEGRAAVPGDKDNIVALDIKTGQVKWSHVGGSASPLAIGDGRIYFLGGELVWQSDEGEWHGTLYALDLQTGKEVWHVEAENRGDDIGTFGPPIYYDGLVYSTSPGSASLGRSRVFALDPRSGQQVWSRRPSDDLPRGLMPVAYNGLLYVSRRFPDDKTPGAPLYAFDARTGEPKWTSRPGPYLGDPVISGSSLYIASNQNENRGTLHSLNPQTGEELDKLHFEYALGDTPSIAGGIIYTRGNSYEPVLEDVLIAVRTVPSTASTPRPGTASPTPTISAGPAATPRVLK